MRLLPPRRPLREAVAFALRAASSGFPSVPPGQGRPGPAGAVRQAAGLWAEPRVVKPGGAV